MGYTQAQFGPMQEGVNSLLQINKALIDVLDDMEADLRATVWRGVAEQRFNEAKELWSQKLYSMANQLTLFRTTLGNAIETYRIGEAGRATIWD